MDLSTKAIMESYSNASFPPHVAGTQRLLLSAYSLTFLNFQHASQISLRGWHLVTLQSTLRSDWVNFILLLETRLEFANLS
jgi:hypothetical protein